MFEWTPRLAELPREVMLLRIATRSTNPFGKGAQERQRILEDLAAVEPLLRATSTVEIVTTIPMTKVVDAIESVTRRADGRSAARSTPPNAYPKGRPACGRSEERLEVSRTMGPSLQCACWCPAVRSH